MDQSFSRCLGWRCRAAAEGHTVGLKGLWTFPLPAVKSADMGEDPSPRCSSNMVPDVLLTRFRAQLLSASYTWDYSHGFVANLEGQVIRQKGLDTTVCHATLSQETESQFPFGNQLNFVLKTVELYASLLLQALSSLTRL